MQVINLASPLSFVQAQSGKPGALLFTTIVDGVDLRIPLVGAKETPLERSAIGNGIHGKVHFLWPEESSLSILTVFYSELSKEHTRRLLAALGPKTIHNKTISFVREQNIPGVVIPGSVSLRVSAQEHGRWGLTLECPAQPHLYTVG